MWRAYLLAAVVCLVLACGDDDGAAPSPSPSRSPAPSASPSPTPIDPGCPTPDTPTPTATASAPPTVTATPAPTDRNAARIIGSSVRAHAEPSTASAVTRTLGEGQLVTVDEVVQGENWIVGDQTFYVAGQGWHDQWYRLVEGDYVYFAWVYVPAEGEVQPWDAGDGERWVDVDTATQTLTAGAGDATLFTTGITSGKPQTPTPPGTYSVHTRLETETMQSAQPGDEYLVRNVLFTQYFSGSGHALHLNYWQPDSVFGNVATSHGCVGMMIHDAQWMWQFGRIGMRVTVR